LIDAANGTAVGDNGTILHTSDGGSTWVPQTSGTTKNLYGLNFSNSSTGTIVGEDGTILRTTTGGATSVDDDPGSAPFHRPDGFILAQNYPNPFNPTTTIQFTIVNRQSTIVNVYDLLGREVAVLVNEVKEPGTYTVQWDANGVSGGVYFYRLRAGDFVQTKRMLMLK
jgi:hypothetical protein